VVNTARRKSKTKTRYVYRAAPKRRRRVKNTARKRYARRAYGAMQKIKMAPLLGGAADVIVRKYIPVNGAGSTATGVFLKDNTTLTIGLNKIGESLGAMFFGNGGGSNGGGWL